MEEISLNTYDIHLRALRSGPSDGARCLCLHGWMDNAESFRPLAAALPTYQIVALDLPGHGRSDHLPAGQRYHLLDNIHYVLAAADALGWNDFVLIGHSMGGAIATFTAAAIPERIRRLVVLEAVGSLSEPAANFPHRLRDATRAMRADKPRRKRTYTHINDAISARLAATQMLPHSARLIVERNLTQTDAGYSWGYDPKIQLPSALYLNEEQVLAALDSLTVPCLTVLARDGSILNRPNIEKRLSAFRNNLLMEVDGQHHMHMDDPDPTAHAIHNFLQKV